MKGKFLIYIILISLLLAGCQDHKTLNTAKLEKIEGNLSKEELKTLPISYEASSLKEGVKALPFKINFPKKLPFEAKPFQVSSIEDMKHDGKKIRASFMSSSKNSAEGVLLMLTVHNFKIEYSGSGKDVKLSNGVIGRYSGNTITFNRNAVFYALSYTNSQISREKHIKHMINIANQIVPAE